MLGDVAGEGDGQVVVEAEPGVAFVFIGLQASEDIYFFVGFAFGEQHVDFFDGGCFDGAEAVAFVDAADFVHPFEFDYSLFG